MVLPWFLKLYTKTQTSSPFLEFFGSQDAFLASYLHATPNKNTIEHWRQVLMTKLDQLYVPNFINTICAWDAAVSFTFCRSLSLFTNSTLSNLNMEAEFWKRKDLVTWRRRSATSLESSGWDCKSSVKEQIKTTLACTGSCKRRVCLAYYSQWSFECDKHSAITNLYLAHFF